jgi:hypothetical protein
MFFSLSKTVQPNFPHNHQTTNFVVSLDEGWTQTKDRQGNNIWYKGYLDNGKLADEILTIIDEIKPTYLGNFCAIRVTSTGINLRSDRQRSFPIWVSDQLITNLVKQPITIWTDDVIDIGIDFTLTHNYFDVIGATSNTINSYETVVEQIDAILAQKTEAFLSNLTAPIKVFLSGGIDTALVFSYIQKYTDQYEIVNSSHCDFDYFYLKNHGTLSKLWGYNQIHHWSNPCVLASGAPGDEFMLRSPTTANLMLLHYGTAIPTLLDSDFKDCLHSIYFNNSKYFEMWKTQSLESTDLAGAIKTCCNYNVNDWQHWHFGNTLTWTPLRDVEIFKLVASLPVEDLIEQVMNSGLSKELIKRNNPKILSYLSNKKNSENYLENLTGFYSK